MEKRDWSIVVLGAWNTAILTPNWVQTKLFGIPAGTPIQVEVPMDRRAPLRVRAKNITVVPDDNHLSVIPDQPSMDALEVAAELATKAINNLPATPFAAAGINVKYYFKTLPPLILEKTQCEISDALSDEEYSIRGSKIHKTLAWGDGVINLSIDENENTSGVVGLNFHISSTESSQLIAWLSQMKEVEQQSDKIFSLLDIKETGEM